MRETDQRRVGIEFSQQLPETGEPELAATVLFQQPIARCRPWIANRISSGLFCITAVRQLLH